MRDFLWGALSMSCFVATLFFVRFRRDSGDRLFSIFAVAFAVLGVHWVLLALLVHTANEHVPMVYCARLLAFGLILAGIVDKNRRQR